MSEGCGSWGRPWPPRSLISWMLARSRALKAETCAIYRCSGSDFGRGAGCGGLDAICQIGWGPRQPAARPKSEQEQRNSAQNRALHAHAQASIRPIKLHAGHGRPHNLHPAESYPPQTHPAPLTLQGDDNGARELAAVVAEFCAVVAWPPLPGWTHTPVSAMPGTPSTK